MDIIVLFFLCRHIGKVAIRKGEKSSKWILVTIGAWVLSEVGGLALAVVIFGTDNIIGLSLIGFMCALGSYLVVKAQLDKVPDIEDDIEGI